MTDWLKSMYFRVIAMIVRLSFCIVNSEGQEKNILNVTLLLRNLKLLNNFAARITEKLFFFILLFNVTSLRDPIDGLFLTTHINPSNTH